MEYYARLFDKYWEIPNCNVASMLKNFVTNNLSSLSIRFGYIV